MVSATISTMPSTCELADREVDAHGERWRWPAGRAARLRSCWHASSRTHWPSGTMRPVSSASGMNASGGQQALDRVVPADERLDAGDAAGLQRHDRLVEQAQLAVLDAAGEVGLELEPLEHAGVHALLEHLVAVLAALLGQVHGHVGVAQQHLGVDAPVGVDGDADAGRDADLAALDGERGLQGEQHALGDLDDLGLAPRRDDEDGELVAAEAGRDVGRVQAGEQPLGDDDEQLVADGVAEAVVDGLEVVDVDEQRADEVSLVGRSAASRSPAR